jgi:hypothetical protein
MRSEELLNRSADPSPGSIDNRISL